MLKLEYIYFLFLGVIHGVFFIGYFLARKKSTGEKGKVPIELMDVDVVIPFRDEEVRLNSLLDSIVKQKASPNHYFFIDDHSSDNSPVLIHSKLKGRVSYSVIKMEEGETGKKRAIRKGVRLSKSKWVLTLDADVQFSEDYFQILSTKKVHPCTVLPVMMTGNNRLQRLFSADYNLSNFVNYAIFGLKRPIMASGANLLFNKDVFHEVDRFEEHQSVSSGDDMFLLRDFRTAQKDVGVLLENKLSAATEAPNSLLDFFSQRVRWIAKTKHIKDGLANSIGIIFLLMNVFFVVTMVIVFQRESSAYLLWFVCAKTIIELFSISVYALQFKLIGLLALFPLIQLCVPVFSFFAVILSFFWVPNWKGRRSSV